MGLQASPMPRAAAVSRGPGRRGVARIDIKLPVPGSFKLPSAPPRPFQLLVRRKGIVTGCGSTAELAP